MQTKDFENLLAALDGLSIEQKSIIETALRENSDLSKVINIIESLRVDSSKLASFTLGLRSLFWALCL